MQKMIPHEETAKMKRELSLGAIRLDSPLLLAPMAGFTDTTFRRICRRMGAGMVYTELVSAEGIRRQADKTLHLLSSFPEERPIAGHIFGSSPSAMAEAARVLEDLGHFDSIDINSGCPMRKVVRTGAGAGLLKKPLLLEKIVRAVNRAVHLPVTVKTRIGYSRQAPESHTIAKAAENGGAKMLAVHARFAVKKHSGPIDLERLADMKESISIPVIGNGGILSSEEADRMWRETGVDAVMIGRGALGNPWIFSELQSHWEGIPFRPPTLDERRLVMREHLEGIAKERYRHRSAKEHNSPEEAACLQFRAHLSKYLKGLRGRRSMMGRLYQLTSVEEVMQAVNELLDHNQSV